MQNKALSSILCPRRFDFNGRPAAVEIVFERRGIDSASSSTAYFRFRFFRQHHAAFLELLALHATVLEPDLHLTLAEVQHDGDLPALLSGDVRR